MPKYHPAFIAIAITLSTIGVGALNGYVTFSAEQSYAAAISKTSTKASPKRTRAIKKFFKVISRRFRKQTPAEQFAAIERELKDAQQKRSVLSPAHGNRIFTDLQKLYQQGYAQNEIERLSTITYSLATYLKDAERANREKQGQNPFTAIERELLEAKNSTSSATLSPDHAKKIIANLDNLERTGNYAKAEIDRLRNLVTELSPWLADEKRKASSETVGDANGKPACVSNVSPVLTADVTDLSRISQITPPGVVMTGNVLKSHSYLWIADGEKVPVYAPVDMTLVSGVYVQHADGNLDFGLIFQVSCEVELRFGHITHPLDQIRAALPTEPQINDSHDKQIPTPIQFKAGDIIAYTSGTGQAHNWDFGMYNTERPDPDAKQYAGATPKDVRANCPYDYFTLKKRSTYRSMFNNEIGSGVLTIHYCD